MKHNVAIAGVGMTRFGKQLERSLSSLAHEAIANALADAGIEARDVQAVWAGTAAAPIVTGQTLIAGQAILRSRRVTSWENTCRPDTYGDRPMVRLDAQIEPPPFQSSLGITEREYGSRRPSRL